MTDQSKPVDVNAFAIAFFEGAHRTVLQAIEGLTDEQLYQQPSPDTNSIGWLAWHLSRWKDQFAARAVGEEQVWFTQGWPEKFGVEPERTGQGDSLEQVAAFSPPRDILVGYVEAAQQSTIERIASISPERLVEDAAYATGREPRPVWRSLVGTVSDAGQHAGQIAYLRGLITGHGWRGY
ncbi:MAG: DinB family protein [Chloroflexi bacterium]|nr:DinB family protein [Chloroflexota bacterium]